MIAKETINDVKKRNEGKDLYLARIDFSDEKNNELKLELIFRRPMVSDMQVFNRQTSEDAMRAQLNLISMLAVYPSPAEVRKVLEPYPIAAAKFVEDNIAPFFGKDVRTEVSAI